MEKFWDGRREGETEAPSAGGELLRHKAETKSKWCARCLDENTQWKCISWADFVHHLPEKPFSPIQEAIKETNFSWNQGGGVLWYCALWSRKPGKILSCSPSWELLKQTVRAWLRNTISYEKGKVCSQKQPGCWITCLLDIPPGPKVTDPEITGPCSFRGLNL